MTYRRVMGDKRKLGQSERLVTGWVSSEKMRDRQAAMRQLDGLNQQDKIVALLEQQTELLRYIADLLHHEVSKGEG